MFSALASEMNILEKPVKNVLYFSCMKNLPAKLINGKLVPFSKLAPASVFKLGKGSKAAVFVDKKGVPKLFAFDTFAFLDVLSGIDNILLDRLSDEEYHDKKFNPAGWLIDKIESKLPLNPKFIASLKKSIKEAEEKGYIPFEDVLKRLHLE